MMVTQFSFPIIVRAKDSGELFLAQFQSTSARGGMYLGFADGTYASWGTLDQDGKDVSSDTYTGVWHNRIVDLSAFNGESLLDIGLVNETASPAGAWEIYYNDIALVSADGTVRPVYSRQVSIGTLAGWNSSGVTGIGQETQHTLNSWDPLSPQQTTNYYHQDHLGTSRLLTSGGGWPVWQGTFAPFGQEVNPQMTTNNYKFTGDENDSESNTEHTQFRQLATTQGRWLSPDPWLGSIDLTNPQSFNRYAYVGNNPVNATDRGGLDQVKIQAEPTDWNCSLNGMASPCSLVSGILGGYGGLGAGGDAGFACPNPTCAGLGSSWKVSTVGSDLLVLVDFWSGAFMREANDVLTLPTGVDWLDMGPSAFWSRAAGQPWFGSLSMDILAGREAAARGVPTAAVQPPFYQSTYKRPLLPQSNYCGPGGFGKVLTRIDGFCQQHDSCFADSDATWFNYMTGTGGRQMQAAIKSCNQKLCASINLSDPTRMENAQAFGVGAVFGCIP
jgi:RHS repeat-associated protein